MRKLLLIAAFFASIFCCSSVAYAQDVHFSQFYQSPLNLNPALTGAYPGDWRVTANYRNQWFSINVPYSTYSVGYDHNFYASVASTSKFSAGLLAMYDQSGVAKVNYKRILFSGGVHPMIGKSTMHLGFNIGWAQKTFNLDALRFPDQYDAQSGDFTLANSGEDLSGYNKNLLNLNAGAAWEYRGKEFNPSIGFAIYNINRPNESFLTNDSRVPFRTVIHAGFGLKTSREFTLLPKVLYMIQGKASELNIGSNFAFNFDRNKNGLQNIFVGAQVRSGFGRNTDAMMIIAGANFERINFGISYDLNIPSLKETGQRRDAIEIAIVIWSGSIEVKPTNISCDRF